MSHPFSLDNNLSFCYNVMYCERNVNMPNWCSNNLSLSHDNPDMISRAKKAIEEGTFFNEFVPLPESEKDNWYDWCCENWGTKWNACDVVFNDYSIDNDHKPSIDYSFQTAWSPPETIMSTHLPKLLKKHKLNDIEITWTFIEEQGWGGIVTITYEGMIMNRQWDELTSHKECMDYGYPCRCEYEEDESLWFDDCK